MRASNRHAILATSLWVAGILHGAPALAADHADGAEASRIAEQRARLHSAMAVQRRHAPDLMAISDVVGTGTGLDPDGNPVIRVLTARPGVASLPAQIEGVPVRARVSGRIYALRGATCEVSGDGVCETTERWPLPAPIGVSVGHPGITAGTIGARVTDGVDVFALSNNHVLANSNQSSIGDPALQPGPSDGGSVAAGDAIGTLYDFEPIEFCTVLFPFVFCDQTNQFDAAIALSSEAELGFATPAGEFGSAPGYGVPHPLIHPAYGDPAVQGDEDLSQLQGLAVQKHGRTTGPTSGTIDTIGLTVDVCYDPLCESVARFEGQLTVPGSFSGPGDSGSLVVTDDAVRHPVALLFAGSATESIVSRIDLVLDRFGVVIDDGGTAGPIVDAALEELATPSYALVDETTTVSVTVRNAGTEPLPPTDVVLDDTTEVTSATLTTPALAPGEQATLDFDWTPTATGPHDLLATLQIADSNPVNDQAAAQVPVLLEPPGLSLQLWTGTAYTDAWTLVTLDADYGPDMVPICTPLYDVTGLGPLVTRVRNASGSSFEVGLGRPWFGAFPGEETSAEVHCMVVRAGVYDHVTGLRMEAVRIDGFATKDHSGSWVGEARSYALSYAKPVVVGQVVSDSSGLPGEIGVWSTFWARGPTSFDPPSAGQLFVGRHTGEDPGPRAAETLVYAVIEAGSGLMDGRAYVADVGDETVRGVDDAPPYVYPILTSLRSPSHAVASPAGMDGLEGGWPILYGANAIQQGALGLAFEEDWYFDPERSHTTEQVAFVVFGRWGRRCGMGFELVLALAIVIGLRRRRCRVRSGGRRIRP